MRWRRGQNDRPWVHRSGDEGCAGEAGGQQVIPADSARIRRLWNCLSTPESRLSRRCYGAASSSISQLLAVSCLWTQTNLGGRRSG